MPKDFRINEAIRAREVRLIGGEGEQLGIVSLNDALQVARTRGIDIVEVAPTAVPPVCRLMDYGKFRYEQAKKEREARKHQKAIVIKEVRLRPKIDPHDLDFKTREVQRHLQQGDKVKVTVMFRGREVTYTQTGREMLDRLAQAVKEMAAIERPAALEGRYMSMVFSPNMIRRKDASVHDDDD